MKCDNGLNKPFFDITLITEYHSDQKFRLI